MIAGVISSNREAMNIQRIAETFRKALGAAAHEARNYSWPKGVANSDVLRIFQEDITSARALGLEWEEISRELARAGVHKKNGTFFNGPEIRVYASRWRGRSKLLNETSAPNAAAPDGLLKEFPFAKIDELNRSIKPCFSGADATFIPPHELFAGSRMLIRLEALSSSRMDGIRCTLKDLLVLEAKGKEVEAPSRPRAVHKVRQYVAALEHFIPVVQQKGRMGLTAKLIHQLHQAVLFGKNPTDDSPIYCEGLSPIQVEHGLGYLVRFMQQEVEPASGAALARATLAHAYFDALHVFSMGNSRVGRLLLTLILTVYGVQPILLAGTIETAKTEYMMTMQRAQREHASMPLVKFMAGSMITARKREEEIAHEFLRLTALWKDRLGFKKSSSINNVIDILPSYPVVTTKLLARLLEVNVETAYSRIEQLTEAGIIEELTGKRHSRVFGARAILRVLEES
ncbi:Fic family protein [Azospirillum canadense]|uniref:Fic family protein n=1 Tax=Azospirillum canadense TaxID=403962 RepID=UPI002225C063|nr:Fic/DOC family N-terminal domain-containing protein [Azospirillum canadense]MCW2238169.1 Fic family protein [Azospirillum canadense]